MVSLVRRRQKSQSKPEAVDDLPGSLIAEVEPVEIPIDDPLYAYLLTVGSPVDLNGLDLTSPTLERLREIGVQVIIPLVGQGELIGALYLGSRLSDQPYSTDDRKLLANLASQVAPAMQVALMVQEQKVEAKERERIQQELEVAALIQHTLLPKKLPDRKGWAVDAFYRPARSVGGDFYDFIDLHDGRLGLTIGDVTDKGVPAALVMATCRSMLRAAASQHDSPGAVLADVNETLVDEIPPAMFVTCLYATIDTESGEMVIANAGHNLPYIRTQDGVVELRATGMPLGLMKDMPYEERTYQFQSGDVMVLTSDGITEAHDPSGEMYGFARLMGQVAAPTSDGDVVGALVADVEHHTGSDAEQEDDITLVVIKRTASAEESASAFAAPELSEEVVLDTFNVASEEGNERIAIDRVVEALTTEGLPPSALERLKTAVGETVMNAIEHGNHYREDLDVMVEVATRSQAVAIRVTDHGGDTAIPEAEVPDIEAKLAGQQTPRGWGLFLVSELVDEMNTTSVNGLHTIELVMNREGEH